MEKTLIEFDKAEEFFQFIAEPTKAVLPVYAYRNALWKTWIAEGRYTVVIKCTDIKPMKLRYVKFDVTDGTLSFCDKIVMSPKILHFRILHPIKHEVLDDIIDR